MTDAALPTIAAATLCDWVRDARQHTLNLISDLSDEQLLGPQLSTVNPLLWELGHVAWFHENWILRDGGRRPSRLANADRLYDSSAVPHDSRWDLFLPKRSDTLRCMADVLERVVNRLERSEPDAALAYFVMLGVFHEDMHGEAFLCTRQTHGYAPPALQSSRVSQPLVADTNATRGDVSIPAGEFFLGATPGEPFVFDNEKWAHPVAVRPFAIARTAVTQAEFAAFVDDQGYHRPELWSAAGWQWRANAGAEQPVYWRRAGAGRWERRDFKCWIPLEPRWPMVHVNWYEAEAYCRWAGRRMPTELEWEIAAAAELDTPSHRLVEEKRRFPWGALPPTAEHANLEGTRLGCCDVDLYAAADSACGCRQMIGNVWEWTTSDFLPYPGFVIDPYRDYSAPWFGTHKVLRGGCWATRGRLLRNTWRNFYRPERSDIWAGFRTCAPST